MNSTNMRPSIELWARKFMSIYHPDIRLNFDEAVEKDPFFNCFTLKIFDNKKITDYYFISPQDNKIAETSKPFDPRLSKYFTSVLDGYIPKLWLGYIIIDEAGQPTDAQRFAINPNQIE